MVENDAARNPRSNADLGEDYRRFQTGVASENFQSGGRFYSDAETSYWQEQNGALVRNRVIPDTEVASSPAGRARYGEIAPAYGNQAGWQDDVGQRIFQRTSRNDVRISGGVTWGNGNNGIYADVGIGERYANRFPHPRNIDYDYDRYGYGNGDYGRFPDRGIGNRRQIHVDMNRGGRFGDWYGNCNHGMHGRAGLGRHVVGRPNGYGSAYGGIDYNYNMRGRPPEFDPRFDYNGGRYGGDRFDRQSEFQSRNSQFRDRYYQEFRARQADAIERSYEQNFQRFRNQRGYAVNREMGGPDGPVVPTRDSRQPNAQPEKLFHGDLNPMPPPGFENEKWNDPSHTTTKYVVGRAVQTDLMPILRQANVDKEAKEQIAENYWRQNKGLIERDGSTIMGYNGEKLLVRDPEGNVFQTDTVYAIGADDEMYASWNIITDPRKINRDAFKS
jgi:hypothetical protein